MKSITELIIDAVYENDVCYVVEVPKSNIRAITSDCDVAHHILDFLSKQYDHSCLSEYHDVNVTHFIMAKDTSLDRKVESFIDSLKENDTQEVED